MEFALSEEQEAIFDVAYSFGQENIAPFAIQWENQGTIPKELWGKISELGFGGIYVSEENGGLGLSRLDAALIFEELAYACPSTSAFLTIHNMATWMLSSFGNNEIKKKYRAGDEKNIDVKNELAYPSATELDKKLNEFKDKINEKQVVKSNKKKKISEH